MNFNIIIKVINWIGTKFEHEESKVAEVLPDNLTVDEAKEILSAVIQYVAPTIVGLMRGELYDSLSLHRDKFYERMESLLVAIYKQKTVKINDLPITLSGKDRENLNICLSVLKNGGDIAQRVEYIDKVTPSKSVKSRPVDFTKSMVKKFQSFT